MELLELDMRGVTFPDAAGALQRTGATASLVRELGDNYAHYHAFLARRLEELGGRPLPEDFGTFEEYAKAWGRVEAVVHAEVTLRRCRGFRRFGQRLDAALARRVPLIRSDGSLASAEE